MSTKKIWCTNQDGDGVEVVKICDARRFYRAHFLAGQAAEELRHKGRDASAGFVLRNVAACYALLGKPVTNTTHGLVDSADYIRDCLHKDVAIYWPFVQNRLLDFLEASYIVGSDSETTMTKIDQWRV